MSGAPPRSWRAEDRNRQRLDLYRATLADLHDAAEVDLAMLSVAVEGLRTLLYAARQGSREPR